MGATLQTSSGNIDLKQAVRIARDFVGELYPDRRPDLRLEEVELSADEDYWLVTYSFPEAEPVLARNPLQAIVSPTTIRSYKVVKIDRHSGEALSMKIRTP